MYIQHKKISIRILMVMIIAVGFVSCRNYKELTKVPQPDTKNMVRDAAENSTDTTSLATIPWKSYFPDAKLQTLIAEGLDHGYNMQVAMTRIQQAEAGLYMSKSAILPSVGAAARVDYTRMS